MLRAAAAFFGFGIVWMLIAPPSVALSAVTVGAAAGALMVGVRFAAGTPLFLRPPHFAALAISQIGAALRSAFGVLRSALAADISLAPALARLKTRSSDDELRGDLARAISATPGLVLVDADSDGLLLHLLDEGGAAAADLSAMEARLGAARRGAS
jgi:multisubunit Na+/H+ antiporter MnhE subunit